MTNEAPLGTAPRTDIDANADTATLNDLIEVLNDGIKFYEESSLEVERDDLKSLFRNLAGHKRKIVQDLSAAVRSLGEEPATSGTFAGSMRKLYAEARTKMSSDKGHEYIAQLEEFEDRILHAFEKAATDSNDATVRGIADRHFKDVRDDHDFMRNLKKGGGPRQG
jgi:uncharacterized protein (TIGR02284 family)